MDINAVPKAKQREEEDVRMERGYAALQRVQQRALQAVTEGSIHEMHHK